MDGNKDEGERCIRLVESLFAQKNFIKALKFAQKADQLYPTAKTKELLAKAQLLCSSDQNDEPRSAADDTTSSSSTRQRNGTAADDTSASSGPGHQKHRSVEYIKNCKDYYEILSVQKSASDAEIKKQYRKLALQFHPDKNKASGAAEAFKAIGNAFAVLSDPEKRKRYDLVGAEDSSASSGMRRRNRSYDYTRGFDDDYNAEEIFNMFFGGGFPSRNVYVYRSGPTYQRHQQHHAGDQNGHSSPAFGVFLQVLPILLFIVISLLGTLVPDTPYSMSRTSKYPYARSTVNMQVPYYVKDGFERDYQGSIKSIEKHVEETYVSNLQSSCFRERNYKENMRYQARFYRNPELEEKARNFPMPSCTRLSEIESKYY